MRSARSVHSAAAGRARFTHPLTASVWWAPNEAGSTHVACCVSWRKPNSTTGGTGACPPRRPERSQGVQSVEHLPQQLLVGYPASRRHRPHLDQVLVDEVVEQDTHHAQRQSDGRGQVGDGDGATAQVQDPAALGAEEEGFRGRPLRATTSIRSKRRSPRGWVRPPVTV